MQGKLCRCNNEDIKKLHPKRLHDGTDPAIMVVRNSSRRRDEEWGRVGKRIVTTTGDGGGGSIIRWGGGGRQQERNNVTSAGVGPVLQREGRSRRLRALRPPRATAERNNIRQ